MSRVIRSGGNGDGWPSRRATRSSSERLINDSAGSGDAAASQAK